MGKASNLQILRAFLLTILLVIFFIFFFLQVFEQYSEKLFLHNVDILLKQEWEKLVGIIQIYYERKKREQSYE